MIITFKEAPELGRLKVVSDKGLPSSLHCIDCSFNNTNQCTIPVRAALNCIYHEIHFEQVKK
jgi:hypothetical protein